MTTLRFIRAKRIARIFAVAAAIGAVPSVALAALITTGLSFAVASDETDQLSGTHFHSDSSGVFGNPTNKAEVGRFGAEEVRGLSEFSLAGLLAGPAFVTFEVFKAGGLFDGLNDSPFTGTITVEAYEGNGAENESDYQAPSTGAVGSFAVSAAELSVGDVLSFDITSIFQDALASNISALGIRLRANPLNPDSQAWTFDNFRLTTEIECTPGAPECNGSPPDNGTVPEPATFTLLGLGLLGLAVIRRRKR